jgi:hypothetical protein
MPAAIMLAVLIAAAVVAPLRCAARLDGGYDRIQQFG